jgi:formate hydrogenlyase subunit 6/NADH:ubiquinone oxidoreductase subunit I
MKAHPKTPRPYRYTLAERLYLPLFVGLVVTLRHFVRNLLRRGKGYTIQYPEERRNYSHRYRGHHILTTRPARPGRIQTSTSRSTRSSTTSICCAAFFAATVSTPAPRKPSS